MSIVETTIADAGQPEVGSQTEALPEAQAEGTQVTQEAPATYTVKVNGVELDVDLDELRNGYMREADYTRKTQELAAQRRDAEQALALANALRRDPQGALQALAEEFGVSELTVEADDDPYFSEIKSLKKELQVLRQAEAARKVDAEINEIKTRFEATDDQINDALQHATRNGVTLATAYKDLFFDDYLELARSLRKKQAVESEVNVQKQAASVVHLGTTSAASAAKPAVSRPKNFREAYLLAKQGIRFDD